MSNNCRLRKCQEREKDSIVNDIVSHLEDFSSDTEERRCGFVGVTGCGKTLVMARSIKESSQRLDGLVSFIWLTIDKGDLVAQTIQKLKGYLHLSGIQVLSVQEAVLQPDLTNCVVVAGYSTLNKEDKEGNPINVVMKDGEKLNFPQVIEQTRQKSIPVVLFIDESHANAFTDKSLIIRDKHIKPAYTLEVSATPNPKYLKWAKHFSITYKEASKSGLVKKNIRQTTFLSWQDGIRAAVNKLQALHSVAAESSANYNPRMLVFLPNTGPSGGSELESVLALLQDEFSWSEKSGDVVVWMSSRKSDNYLACKPNNSQVKVVLTKEAIDTGVDIPAFQVIVQLRPAGNTRVEVQKLGRGVRMPEQKHYDNALDTLYFFVFNDYDLDFTGAELMSEVMGEKYSHIRPQFVGQGASFPKVKLSYFSRKSSLLEAEDELFDEIFVPIFCDKLSNHPGFSMDASYSEETKEGSIDLDTMTSKYDVFKRSILAEDSIDSFYTDRIRTSLKHLFKHLGTIESCIGKWLENKALDASAGFQQIFVLNNFREMDRLIYESIEEGEQTIGSTKVEISMDYHLPREIYLSGDGDIDTQYQKFLHDKLFITRGGRSSIESSFEQFLEKSSKVLWWMRNYDRQYGVSYSVTYDGDKVFFPDYIIALTDGTYIIADTKPDNFDVNETAKREALTSALTDYPSIRSGLIKQEREHFYLRGAGDNILPIVDLL